MFDLTGKAVVVTGGGRGIGRGITRAMARAGANLVIAGRTAGPLHDAATEVRSLGADALDVPTDITDPDDVAALIARTIDAFGAVDCWVNNAGSAEKGDVGALIDLTERQWDAVVDLNLKWTFFAAQAAARAMTRGGSIINISSLTMVCSHGDASRPPYSTGQCGVSSRCSPIARQNSSTAARSSGSGMSRCTCVQPGRRCPSMKARSSARNARSSSVHSRSTNPPWPPL